MPPSAEMVSPVTKRAASDARNTITSAMSSGCGPAAQRRLRSIALDHSGDRLVLGPQRGVDDARARPSSPGCPCGPELHRERARRGVDARPSIAA